MAALWYMAGHYFCPVVSFYLLSSFFPPLNLSSRRLDVYHTSTHGVALVRIYNADLKIVLHAARWKHRTQKIAIVAPSHNFVELYLRN